MLTYVNAVNLPDGKKKRDFSFIKKMVPTAIKKTVTHFLSAQPGEKWLGEGGVGTPREGGGGHAREQCRVGAAWTLGLVSITACISRRRPLISVRHQSIQAALRDLM
jgi:hypothetical protein